MYLKSFRRLTEEPPVETFDDEMRFSNLLRTILNEHSSVISMLAAGFRECRSRITDTNLITGFLNRTLTSRMATRLLAEHHLALRENRPHHVGIIDQRMALTDVVKKQIELVSGMFQLEYGMAPEVILAGQTDLVFPYIRIPLDYILTELFKNAFRATIESRCRTAGKLPPIYVTLASDEVDFWIRITDHAGGIPSDLEHAIWEYHVSTPAAAKVEAGWEQLSTKHGSHSVVKEPDVLPPPTATGGALGPHARLSQTDDIDLPLNVGTSSQVLPSNKIFCSITQHQVTKSIHGFGFGLPLSRAYARQLGGDLQMYTIRSIGTDCYLRLRHIDGKTPSFRI
ncbi:[3-methyl-2-oxobutanoate dehydrogenase [lipoamide]] kinase mitochondrial [Clonorchis sinensis]|nr:[3-methyl-2-oxobutanoate dehydrogenase [lipoamide]] kinase mitochondrial [Clonorchis sinensis]